MTGEQVESAMGEMEPQEPAVPQMVVGIGASAGGLQALQELFDELPSSTGMSFVVVQHLSPDFKSMMVQLLGRRASMKVQEVEDGVHPEPDTVYLLPPRNDIELSEGRLRLRKRDAAARLHMPIDLFFHSLAVDQGEMCAAVVLSGTGTDGSRGIVAIRQAGGLVLAQSPESSKFDGMPIAAAATGLVDFVGTPGEIAGMVLRRALPEQRDEVPGSLTALQALFAEFRRQTGIDLSKYKDTTVSRRVHRRMQITGQDSLESYLEYAQSVPSEIRQLRLEMLIGVSSFFRDADTWEHLRTEVLPGLVGTHRDRPLRVWVSACSTGEEAYTLAILLNEVFRGLDEPVDYKLFATDVSEEAIRQASDGLYSEKAVAHIDPELLHRYFETEEQGYRVKRTLRERITFAVHNLLVDPPFTRLALVSCRNMLIYLKPDVQQAVLARIQFGILPGGLLFLGASETVGDLQPKLTVRSSRHKVFESLGGAAPMPALGATVSRSSRTTSNRGPLEGLYHSVLNRFVPPGVATDARFEILHVFGDVRPYITFPQGRMSTNLLRMLPAAASVLVSSAARRALGGGDGIVVTGVSLGEDARDIRVYSYERAPQGEAGYLVFFDPGPSGDASAGDQVDIDEASQDRLRQLEMELGVTRQHLHTAVQDLEASNEELQATNEELVASNEELQSTNEELQSVNEELYTVNAEYQTKIGQLEELSDDLGGLLKSIQLGAVFLDQNMAIRRYNDVATQVIPLLTHDQGRHLADLRWHIDYPDLEQDVGEVVRDGKTRRRVAVDVEGRNWEVTIQRHQHDSGPAGVLMILADVTDAHERERRLADQAALYDAASRIAGLGIAILDVERREIEISESSKAVIGLDSGVLIEFATFQSLLEQEPELDPDGRPFRTLITTDRRIPVRVEARPGSGGRKLVVAFQPVEAGP